MEVLLYKALKQKNMVILQHIPLLENPYMTFNKIIIKIMLQHTNLEILSQSYALLPP